MSYEYTNLIKLSIFIINIITLIIYILNNLNKYNSTQINKNKGKYGYMIKSFITLVNN